MRRAAVAALLAAVASLAPARPAAADPPTCFGQPATIVGTDGQDNLVGTTGDDVIVALAGKDKISGRLGDDVICAGPGDDLAQGEGGTDRIDGGEGHDQLSAGGGFGPCDCWPYGDDLVLGGPGDDRVFGSGGNDTLDAGPGGGVLNGGVGNDVHLAGTADGVAPIAMSSGGDDTFHGAPGELVVEYTSWPTTVGIVADLGTGVVVEPYGTDTLVDVDTLAASRGDDVVRCGDAPCTVDGFLGDDRVRGGRGDDVLWAGHGDDEVVGGPGSDTVAFGAIFSVAFNGADLLPGGPSDADLVVDLAAGAATGEGADTLATVEHAVTGYGDDVVTGTAAGNRLDGGYGDDALWGVRGDDTLVGGPGLADACSGGGGTDQADGCERVSGVP